MSQTVLSERRNSTALLTLNRPEKLNALNFELIDSLMGHFDEIERNGDIRAVVLTGSGEQAFSAGADIAEISESVSAGQEVALRDFVRRVSA